MNFKEELIKLNIKCDEDVLDKFSIYYNYLIEVNSYMDLTAITDKEEVYNKHFLDSLEIYNLLPSSNITLCDVGSGAGFPSVPLAIVDSKIKVTIIDSLNKRIVFLNDLIKKLNISNVEAYHYRAEDYAKKENIKFDVVTARAVAKLNVLAELCLPLVKVGGIFIAMKGSNADQELVEAKNAIKVLGGSVIKTVNITLPDDVGKREIILIKKIKETDKKYPRIYAKIKERPL